MKNKILVVDDEEDICEILQFNLEGEDFEVDVAYSGEEALKKDITQYDLIILDVMMDKLSGYKVADIIRKDRNINTPIIFLTAKNTENDILTGFNIGGDDYITKPFSIKEIIVRIKAVLKRTSRNQQANSNSLSFENLIIDIEQKSLSINGSYVTLTKKEFKIIEMLLKESGRIFTREEILKRVWEDDTIVSNRTIDVHITRLRKKLGEYGKYLKNKPGFGYTFNII